MCFFFLHFSRIVLILHAESLHNPIHQRKTSPKCMRHEKLEHELNLLLMLTENHNLTVADICSNLQISRRSFYYYIDFFRQVGFKIEHSRPYYRIRRDSPFFRKLDEILLRFLFASRIYFLPFHGFADGRDEFRGGNVLI